MAVSEWPVRLELVWVNAAKESKSVLAIYMEKLHCEKERQHLVWPETYSRVLNLIHGISLKEDFNGEMSLLFFSTLLSCLSASFSFSSHLNGLSQITAFLGCTVQKVNVRSI